MEIAALVPVFPAEVTVPEDWNYDVSVEHVRSLSYQWKNLTVDVFQEMLTAREALSQPGRPWGKRTWAGYCAEIGVPKYTANEWLRRLTGGIPPVKPHVALASGENEWYTPKEYIEAARTVLGNIELDPASSGEADAVVRARRYYTIESDGLSQEWSGHVWMNPPYASDLVGKFTKKLCRHYDANDVPSAVVLVNNATETVWFQELASRASAICFPERRVKFWGPGGGTGAPLQGQAVIYLGSNVAVFRDRFGRFGLILYAG